MADQTGKEDGAKQGGESRYARIAEIANEAHSKGLPATQAVADMLGVSLRYSSTLLHRARNAGWNIPKSRKTMTDARRSSINQLRFWNTYRGDIISQEAWDRGSWRENANCKGINPNLFHPERGANGYDITAAKTVCFGCLVRQQCLEYALENNEQIGIWGGLSERERRRIRSRRFHERRIIGNQIA